MANEIRFRLVLDNTQYLAATASSVQGSAVLEQSMVGGATRAARAMDGLAQAAQSIGPTASDAAHVAAPAFDGVARSVDSASAALARNLDLMRAAAASRGTAASTVTAAAPAAASPVMTANTAMVQSALAEVSKGAADAAQRLGLLPPAAKAVGTATADAGQQASHGLAQVQQGGQRAADGLSVATRAASTLNMSFLDMVKGSAVFSVIESSVRSMTSAISAVPKKGLSFLAESETAQLGMAGILQSMTEIDGRATTFAQAQDIAAASTRRLQQAAAETAADSGELIKVFGAIMGPAVAAGMSMQQVERLTVVGTNAVKSMGLSGAQVVQELRDLVQGGITASGSTLATALGLKDADIAKAKASTEGLYTFLMNRMSGFASASDAYGKTLKGSMEALEEQVTQSAARSMAPVAEAAKKVMDQVGQALKGDSVQSAMDGIGQGMAKSIETMASGVAVAQQYGGAVTMVAGAWAAVKVGTIGADIARVTAAKIEGINASRLTAAQAVLEGEAEQVAAQSSRARLAALIAEERAKVSGLATEAAMTAAVLRTAEAQAAQLTGLQRLAAMESTVLPLRQQHATQTAALEAAQNRLAQATTASSAAMRGMGMVMGALGGGVGLAITALATLVGYLVQANDEANKLKLVNLSTERIENQLSNGSKISPVDASRVQAELAKAQEERDSLLVKTRQPQSMYDRSPGLFGGKSNAQKLMDELAEAEKRVAKFESLVERVQAAQGGATQTGAAGVSSASKPVAATGSARERFAAAAAEKLGVPLQAVQTHMALETRRDGSGTVGDFNYGNIKAGSSWKGQVKTVDALEYDASGRAYTEKKAAFRSYGTPEEAADDYAALIQRRFKGAVGAKDVTTFAQGLKSGGYASDPEYVEKFVGTAKSIDRARTRVGTERGRGSTGASTTQAQGVISMNEAASSKLLDDKLEKAGGVEDIRKKYTEELQGLDQAAKVERAAMVRRGASQDALLAREKQVSSARTAIQKEMHDKIKAEEEKGLGEVSAISKAQAEQLIGQKRAEMDASVRLLDEASARNESARQNDLVSVEAYESEKSRIARAKLDAKLRFIDEEIAAEKRLKPKDKVETINKETKISALVSERRSVSDEQSKLKIVDTGRIDKLKLDEDRQIAAENVQVWSQANQQVQALRGQNTQTAIGLITDPAEKMRAEVAQQIAEVKKAAADLSRDLTLRIDITRGQAKKAGESGQTGEQASLLAQAEMLNQQRQAVEEQTVRAIDLANQGLADRLKPSWVQMLEGWRDVNRLMREAADQTMQGLVSGAENAFVDFVKTGKLSIKGLVDDFIANQARLQFRKFMSGDTGTRVIGAVAKAIGAAPADKQRLDADQAGPVMPDAVASERALSGMTDSAQSAAGGLRDSATEGNALAGALKGAGSALGGFGGDLLRAGSQLISVFQNMGSGGSSGGSSWGSVISGAIKAYVGAGSGSAGNAGAGDYSAAGLKAAYGYADGGVFGAQRFAAGGSFTNKIVDKDTNFRFVDGGREKLGLMGEAGPEAIMPLSGGGARAIDRSGRVLDHLPVTRDSSGRLSVVLPGERGEHGRTSGFRLGNEGRRRFADGGVFAAGTAPTSLTSAATSQLSASASASAASKTVPSQLSIDASTDLHVMDMSRIQQMVAQACMGTERRIYERLKAVGVMR